MPSLPPPGVIVVFRVRQELQSFHPPQCLPGSAAANLRLRKTASAVTNPASSSQPTEKRDIGKTTQCSGGDSKWMRAVKHPCFSFWESSSVENFSLFPPCSLAFPLGALLPRVTLRGLWFAAALQPGGSFHVSFCESGCVSQIQCMCLCVCVCCFKTQQASTLGSDNTSEVLPLRAVQRALRWKPGPQR